MGPNVIDKAPPKSKLRQARLLLWLLVLLAALGLVAAVVFAPREHGPVPEALAGPVKASTGAPFTLVGGDGSPFSSQVLGGKPYALYFGFTRCGDVCPTTLSRLVKLRREAANDEAFQIVFITIDPAHDGPREVGQYAGLFNAPIIGLTGSVPQIEAVKKRYGIFAQPTPHAAMGKEVEHSAVVLLFDRNGQLAGTIMPDDSDADALLKLKKLVS